ncbi:MULTISPECIES: ABC transporter permease [Listeria]|uniref:ABC transporter permease n=1 Tax=Listeria TaxID=1637 RepID=UPI000B58D8DF|nr:MULTISPECIES: ABC transporter permease [Listeria]
MQQQTFYFKKFFKTKGNWIPLFVLVATILFVLIMNTITEKEHDMAAIADLNMSINEQGFKNNQKKRNNGELSKEDEQLLDENQVSTQQLLTTYQKIRDYYNSGQYKQAYALKIKEIEKSIAFEKETFTDNGMESLNIRDLTKYKKLQELNINEQVEDMETQGFTYLYRMLVNFFPLLIIIVSCFALTSVLTERFHNGLDRMKLMPLSSFRNTTERLVFSTCVALIIYFLSILFAFLPATVLSGLGSLNYPILSEMSGGYVTLPVGKLLLETIILQMLSLLIVILVIDLISKIVKKAMPTLFLSLILLIAPTFLIGKVVFLDKIAAFLPMTYFNSGQVTNYFLAEACNNPTITFVTGVIVLLISLCLLLVINYYIDWKGGENSSHFKQKK